MGTVMDVYKLISSLMDEARKAKNDNMISQLIDIKIILSDIQTEKDAISARKIAEEKIWGDFLTWYEQYIQQSK